MARRSLDVDGVYRLRAERDGDRVRLVTRGGYDWAKRYPWIVEAALKNRYKRFVIDGEAVARRRRRLPPAGRARRRSRAAGHARRIRLGEALSLDRRGRAEE